ncbi:MAG: hypothetical protein RL701_6934, partial [Pseudomonadota bacterium]
MVSRARLLVLALLFWVACDDDTKRETPSRAGDSAHDTPRDASLGDHDPGDDGSTPPLIRTGDAVDSGTHEPAEQPSSEPPPPQETDAPVDDTMPPSSAPPPTVPMLPQRPACVHDDAADELDAGSSNCVPPPPDCTGKQGAPGTTTHQFGDRSYLVHIPPAFSPNTPLPVMLVFHGAGGTGEQMQAGTGFDILADQLGIVTIYPDGKAGNAPWNVGRNVCPPGNFVSTTDDDIAYVDQILQTVEADQCIDKRRIFATGFSMGGYFSNELGCRVGRTTLRAIAPHSGGAHSGSCDGAPLPVLLLHGDSDSLISYQCGTNARDYWLERNGCSADYDRADVTGGYCDFYRNCPASGAVVMCTFKGLDHGWAFPPMYESSSWLIWLFFS